MPKAKRARKTGGRSKGTPNKVTAAAREVMALLVEANAPKLQKWLDRVAKTDPARAADLLLRALEYHIPKLARTEHTGKDGDGLFSIRALIDAVGLNAARFDVKP